MILGRKADHTGHCEKLDLCGGTSVFPGSHFASSFSCPSLIQRKSHLFSSHIAQKSLVHMKTRILVAINYVVGQVSSSFGWEGVDDTCLRFLVMTIFSE